MYPKHHTRKKDDRTSQTSIRRKRHQSPVKAESFVCFFRSKCETFYPFVHPWLFIRFCQFWHYRCLFTCTATVKSVKTLKHACVCTYRGKSYHYQREEDREGEGREVHGKPKQACIAAEKINAFCLSLPLSVHVLCKVTTYQTLHCRQQAKKTDEMRGPTYIRHRHEEILINLDYS